jgi:hypothetical protein
VRVNLSPCFHLIFSLVLSPPKLCLTLLFHVFCSLLADSGPFPWQQVVADTEVPYYLSHLNACAFSVQHTIRLRIINQNISEIRGSFDQISPNMHMA